MWSKWISIKNFIFLLNFAWKKLPFLESLTAASDDLSLTLQLFFLATSLLTIKYRRRYGYNNMDIVIFTSLYRNFCHSTLFVYVASRIFWINYSSKKRTKNTEKKTWFYANFFSMVSLKWVKKNFNECKDEKNRN